VSSAVISACCCTSIHCAHSVAPLQPKARCGASGLRLWANTPEKQPPARWSRLSFSDAAYGPPPRRQLQQQNHEQAKQRTSASIHMKFHCARLGRSRAAADSRLRCFTSKPVGPHRSGHSVVTACGWVGSNPVCYPGGFFTGTWPFGLGTAAASPPWPIAFVRRAS